MIIYEKDVETREIPNPENVEGAIVARDYVKDGEVPHVRIFSQLTVQPGFQVPMHTHENEIEINTVIKGRALMNDGGVDYILEVGDSHVNQAGSYHNLVAYGDEPVSVIVCFVKL